MTTIEPQFQFKEYLEEKFKALGVRLDELMRSAERQADQVREEVRDISQRLGNAESRLSTVEANRPTYSQLLAAAVASIALAVSLATAIFQIIK